MNSDKVITEAEQSAKHFTGISAVGGLVRGPAWVLHIRQEEITYRVITQEQVADELARFHLALKETRAQITQLAEQVAEGVGVEEAGVFDAHLMVVDDELLIGAVEELVRESYICAEVAVIRVAQKYSAKFSAMDDAYMRERSSDILDIGRRVVRNLLGVADTIPSSFERPHIIVADDLTPSQTVTLPRGQVLGIVTDRGSVTSHTAIIARALGIPAVVGLRNISVAVRHGDEVLLDGDRGTVKVRPTAAEAADFEEAQRSRREWRIELGDVEEKSATTPDGHTIRVLVNADHTFDWQELSSPWCEGVGLYRTESLWLQLGRAPTEDEQVAAYGKAARAMKGRQVVFRVLDIGGDKSFGDVGEGGEEANPFLGLRSIRYLLREREVFRQQLRAILRVSTLGDVCVMYPMVCDLAELKEADALLQECKAELLGEGVAFNDKMAQGVMVEIPSAAIMASQLARHCDFLCLGTNDLTQYTLAVDRANENVAALYQPTHPAVLWLVRETIEAARDRKLWCSVCGEMAGDPLLAVLLMGMGADTLSMSPAAVPAVKYVISKTPYADARRLARAVARAGNGEQALEMCRDLILRTAPEALGVESNSSC